MFLIEKGGKKKFAFIEEKQSFLKKKASSLKKKMNE